MIIYLSVIILFLLSGQVLGDIKLTGLEDSYDASSPMEVEWKDDGKPPSLTTLTSMKFLLCTGPNDAIHCFDTPLSEEVAPAKMKTTIDLTPLRSVGANGMYYIQISTQTGDKGVNLYYSHRFKLTAMTGTYKPTTGGDVDPPEGENQAAGGSAIAGASAVTYTKQTGKTKIAPMQSQPGTKVNLKRKRSTMFPTSPVTFYKTIRKSPNALTTLTPSWSYTIPYVTNYAPTRPAPTKFYAASKVLKKNYRSMKPSPVPTK